MASPLPLPRDLTIPAQGSTTARDVLSRSLGRLLLDLAAIPRGLPTSARHPLALGHDFPERFAQVRALNREGAGNVLAHAVPTPIGRAVLDEIRGWIDHFGE